MTKYVRVNKAPKELKPDELVINFPTFNEEIIKSRRSRGRQQVLTINYLRSIFTEIGASVDPVFNPYLDINLTKYKGLPAADEAEASARVLEIIGTAKPELIEKAIAKEIAARPSKVKLIYYVAPDFTYSSVFSQHGIDAIEKKDIDKYLGRKKAKNTKLSMKGAKLHKEDGTIVDLTEEEAKGFLPKERSQTATGGKGRMAPTLGELAKKKKV